MISNYLSIGLIALAISIFFLSFRRGQDIFSPARFWIMLWLIVIGVTQLQWSYYQEKWSFFTWLTLLSGLGAYLVGVFCIYVIHIDNRYGQVSNVNNNKNKFKYINFHRLEHIIIALIIIYSLAYLLEYLYVGFLPFFSEKPSETRLEFDVFGIHLIVNSVLAIVALITEFLLLGSPSRTKRFMYGIIVIGLLLSYFFLMNRLYYLLMIVIYLMVRHYSIKPVSLKIVGGFAIGFIALFFIIGNIRLVQYAEDFLYIVSDMKIPRQFAYLAGPYMYISMNLENLNSGIEQLTKFSWGAYSFDFAWALFRVQEFLHELLPDNHTFQASDPFTTFPYLWYFYRDFGFGGVMVLSYLMGTIVSWLYWKLIEKKKLLYLAVYSFVSTGIFLSFFTNMFTRLNFIVNLFVVILVHMFVQYSDDGVVHSHVTDKRN